MTAPASAQQTVNFTLGGFVPQGAGRAGSRRRARGQSDFLLFRMQDFNSLSVGGEWLIPFGRFVEGGVGLSYTRKTVPSVYADFVDSDGIGI